jgi:serine/threonine protein kinase
MYGKYYGDKADIWSIGCILLELVLAYDYEVRHAVAACPRHYKSHRLIFGVLLRVGNARQGIIWSRNFRLCDKTPR